MIIIRVTPSDEAFIADILANHIDASDRKKPPSASHLQALLSDDRSYLFAAVEGRVVTGYALAYRFPSLYASEYLAYLYDIEVSPDYRRRGIGTQLIEAVLERLRPDGVAELWLGTGVDNPEGQGLFSATGAVRSGETFNDYTYYLSESGH